MGHRHVDVTQQKNTGAWPPVGGGLASVLIKKISVRVGQSHQNKTSRVFVGIFVVKTARSIHIKYNPN